ANDRSCRYRAGRNVVDQYLCPDTHSLGRSTSVVGMCQSDLKMTSLDGRVVGSTVNRSASSATRRRPSLDEEATTLRMRARTSDPLPIGSEAMSSRTVNANFTSA